MISLFAGQSVNQQKSLTCSGRSCFSLRISFMDVLIWLMTDPTKCWSSSSVRLCASVASCSRVACKMFLKIRNTYQCLKYRLSNKTTNVMMYFSVQKSHNLTIKVLGEEILVVTVAFIGLKNSNAFPNMPTSILIINYQVKPPMLWCVSVCKNLIIKLSKYLEKGFLVTLWLSLVLVYQCIPQGSLY